MKKGFTTLGLLAATTASLLSGSVFALGPTITDIPTVVISDRTKDPNEFDNPLSTTQTANYFRVTSILALGDYVEDLDTADNQLKWLFTERVDAGDASPTSPSSITINGSITGGAADPDKATTDATGNTVDSTPLDFQNTDFSPFPVSLPYGTPSRTLPETRTIRLFVSDPTNADPVVGFATSDFRVVTTNASGSFDGTTTVQPFFKGPQTTYDNFDGWQAAHVNGFTDYSQNNSPYYTPFLSLTNTTSSPTGTPVTGSGAFGDFILNNLSQTSNAPSLTSSIAVSGSAGVTDGVAVFWGSNTSTTQRVAVTAYDIYRVRYNITSTDANNTNHSTLRLRIGAANGSDTGTADATFNGGAAAATGANSGSPLGHNVWLAPQVNGTMDVFMDIFDFADTTHINASLDSVDINVTDRSLIEANGTKTVVQNVGSASFTLFGGQPAVESAGQAAFGAPTTNFNFATDFAPSQSPARAVTRVTTGSALVWNIAARDAVTKNETFAELGFGNTTTGFFAAAPGNTLEVIDVWIHAGTADSDRNPVLRGYVLPDQTSTAYAASFTMPGAAFDNGNGSGSPNDSAFQTTSRRFTWVMQPQIGSGVVQYPLYLDAFVFDFGKPDATSTQGSVTVDRITVTEYSGLPNMD